MGSEILPGPDEHVDDDQTVIELINQTGLPNQEIPDMGHAQVSQPFNGVSSLRCLLDAPESSLIFAVDGTPDSFAEVLLDVSLDVFEIFFGAVQNDDAVRHAASPISSRKSSASLK